MRGVAERRPRRLASGLPPPRETAPFSRPSLPPCVRSPALTWTPPSVDSRTRPNSCKIEAKNSALSLRQRSRLLPARDPVRLRVAPRGPSPPSDQSHGGEGDDLRGR